MNPNASSFEAMIGLALRGTNWQQLQDAGPSPHAAPAPMQQTSEAEDPPADEVRVPRALTAKQSKKMKRFGRSFARDTGDVFYVIETDMITPVAQEVSWDNDPELLCSYNWQASVDGTNAIFVPGAPAKWQAPSLPFAIEKDKGIQFTDYNYARQPRDPYKAMFHALNVMNPNYRFNDVDVLADRNNLRVLLEFCQGKANGPFRLNIYLVYNTLIITRQESKWWMTCNDVSRGWNFEKHFTHPTEGLEEATSHYRAIRYPLGPLNAVVRFEADAYDDGTVSDVLRGSETPAVSDEPTGRPNFTYNSPIRVLKKGRIIPTDQMVELKTQKYDPSGRSRVQCQDQLWFGRTSLLFTGPYDNDTGVIEKVTYETATPRIKSWEKSNQESLRKLPALIMHLREFLKQSKELNRAAVLLREEKGGPLTIRSLEGSNTHAFGSNFFRAHWTSPQASSQSHRGRQQPHCRGKPHETSRSATHSTVPQHVMSRPNIPQNGGVASKQSVRGQRGRGRGPLHAPLGRGNAQVPANAAAVQTRVSNNLQNSWRGGRGRGMSTGATDGRLKDTNAV